MLGFKKITNHFLSKNIWSVEKLIIRNISTRQIELVKATAPVLANRGVEITTHFYKNMLGDNPELRNVFNLTHQATGAQAAALAHAVWLYADNIDNLDALKSAISRIGNKHASLGVKPDDYSIVGKYLLFSIKSVLGDSIDDETLESWKEAYKQLAAVFIKTEGDLYKSAKNTAGGWGDWRRFVVSKKIQESNEIISFYLTPEDGKILPVFKPGQFVTVRCFIPELSVFQLRQYSLSDTFDDKYFRISVKREYAIQDKPEGYISNILHNSVKEGSVIEVSMPYGDFFLDVESQDPVVLISGGVGLTPMMSMLKSLIKQGSGRKITFIHAARSGEVHAMKEDLEIIVKENPQVSKVVFYESVTEKDMKNKTYDHIGRINLDFIKKELLATNADYYLCGPVQFMTIQKDKLRNLGIQEGRIHSEIFSTS